MVAKTILVLCAQALLNQSAFSQRVSPVGIDLLTASPCGLGSNSWAYDGLGHNNLALGHNWASNGVIANAWPAIGLPCTAPLMEITPTAGGLLPVTSTSAIPPVGISVVSANAYEGLLTVAGEVPFVGTTGLDGDLSTGGTGAVNYGCGSGVTAMVSEVTPATAFAPAVGAADLAPAIANAVISPDFASNAHGLCGCGYGF